MSKFCPQCEKENPSGANHCMYCGSALTPTEKINELDKLHHELSETKKTNELLKSVLEEKLKKKEDKTEENHDVGPSIPPSIQPQTKTQTPHENNKKVVGLIVVLAVVALIVFGCFYYFNVYMPAKIDREADRYYTFADKTNLRSTKEVGADYNRVSSLNYGSELITYSHDIQGWSNVKDALGNKGYISSNLLLSKSDFFILNGIFGDQESRQCVNTSKCRLALLDYYKNNSLDENWKVFCRPKDVKPNAVFFPRLYNKISKFTDFAVIIKNTRTGERRIVIFGFNDDETLAWTRDGYAPQEGYIKNIINKDGRIQVEYSN